MGCGCTSSNPYYRAGGFRPAYLSAQYRDDMGCACGGRREAAPTVVAVDCGCGCKGAPGGCGGGERSAGDITPPGRPCPGGWARLPDNSCPGDTPTGGGGGWQGNAPATGPCPGGWARRLDGSCPGDTPTGGVPCPAGQVRDPVTQQCVPAGSQTSALPPGWENWNAEQRAAYARDAVARAGGSSAEQQAAAERARQADNAMVVGIVTQGVAALRQWLQADSAETIARIQAQAQVQIEEIRARSQGQGNLWNQYNPANPYGQNPYQQPVAAPSAGGGVETIGVLAIVAKLLGLF